MDIEFKKIDSDADIEVVAGLAKRIWTEHYPAIIGSAQVDYMLATFQSFSAIKEQIAQRYQYYLLVNQEVPVGYLAFQLREPDELFLSKVYLLKRQRGQGYGRACIGFVTDCAKRAGACTVVLTVNKDNLNSCTAYERWGFKRTRSVVADIGNGFVMDDWEYRLAL